jgi:hypothetical protein
MFGFGDGPALRGGGGPPQTGLSLWLNADVGVTLISGKVSQWNDQSGNNNHVTQSDASLRPTVSASSVNAKAGITFDTLLSLITTNDIIANGQPRTLVAVVKPAFSVASSGIITGSVASFRTAGRQMVFTFEDATGSGIDCLIYSDAIGNVDETTNSIQATAGVGVELEWEMVVGSPPLFRNNAVDQAVQIYGGFGDGNVHDDNGGSPSFYVGNYSALNGGWRGDINMLFVYDHILSGADKTTLRTYLNGYYGVP